MAAHQEVLFEVPEPAANAFSVKLDFPCPSISEKISCTATVLDKKPQTVVLDISAFGQSESKTR